MLSQSALIYEFENLQMIKYLEVASFAFLVYDYILNIHREVQLIWFSRLSLVKLLYLTTRYSAFLTALTMLLITFYPTFSLTFCKAIGVLSSTSSALLVISASSRCLFMCSLVCISHCLFLLSIFSGVGRTDVCAIR